MEQKNVERNIKLFAWFQILREPLFWGPILVTYIINVGKMELSELYFMESVVVLGMIFVEIYSSAWADLLGRKKMLLLGSFLTSVAIILFSAITSPMLVWVANILIMLGASLVSGVDEAFLVDTLKGSDQYGQYTKINGRIMARRYILVAVACIMAGYLYSINPRLPMLLSIPAVIASFVLVFFMHEPAKSIQASQKEHFKLMKMSILFVANHKKLKWIIVYMAVIAVASKLWFFTYNPYFELVELDPKYFGWVFFVFNLICWAASKYAYKIENFFSEFKLIVLMLLMVSVPIFLMGTFVVKLSLAFLLLDNISRGFKKPFFSNFMNKHLDSKNRATVLSINFAVIAAINAFSLWIYGMVLARYELAFSLQLLGITILLIGAYSLISYRRIFLK